MFVLLGTTELIIILGIALFIFGAKKLPKSARFGEKYPGI